MTENALGAFSYSFGDTYYENFKSNRIQELKNIGQFNAMFSDLWVELDSTKSLKGVTVNNGIDIRDFVRKVYNGSQVDCMFEGYVHDIADWVEDNIHLGGLECFIGNMYRKAGDLLGSFICTVTLDTVSTDCGKAFLDKLKKYRDDVIMTDKEGIDMVRYYGVIGPQVVAAMEADPEKQAVSVYLWNKYIHKLGDLVDDGDRIQIVFTYFSMLDEMVKFYGIPVTARFNKWVEAGKHNGVTNGM